MAILDSSSQRFETNFLSLHSLCMASARIVKILSGKLIGITSAQCSLELNQHSSADWFISLCRVCETSCIHDSSRGYLCCTLYWTFYGSVRTQTDTSPDGSLHALTCLLCDRFVIYCRSGKHMPIYGFSLHHFWNMSSWSTRLELSYLSAPAILCLVEHVFVHFQ